MCAYAYSVDDALGNVQADGQGFIVDVGSTINLENSQPCSAPIQISLGYSVNDTIRFTQYAICGTTADRIRTINPAFPAFVISSNNPANCPIYVWDNKATPQLYTFTVNVTMATLDQLFPFFVHPTSEWQPIKWIPFPPPNPVNGYPPGSTARPIVCTGNTSSSPFQPSSANWCCDKIFQSGVYAYSSPEALAAHATKNYLVTTTPASPCIKYDPLGPAGACKVAVQACSQGQ
jgi:hypothetical protein